MDNKIFVTKSSMPGFAEYCDTIQVLWENKWLSNRGVLHKELEIQLSNYLKSKNIALFANGHVALEVTLDAFDLKGEVITTPFTHCSTTHAIVRNNLKPIFCDINATDYNIDVNDIKSKITDNTTAIVATHVYGNVCDVQKLSEIASDCNLKLIYDGAHAFGVSINGENISSYGDATMFSCHATKVYHTIEGGITTYNDDEIFSKIDSLTNFGFTGHETVDYISTNARMNEFEAAMGICNLRHIGEEIEKRKKVVERYNQNLFGIHGLKLNTIPPHVKSNYAYYPVVFDGYRFTRDQVFEKLEKHDIYARKYFYPTTNNLSCYAGQFDSSETPVATYIAKRVLTLPLYSDLSLEDVDRICAIITT